MLPNLEEIRGSKGGEERFRGNQRPFTAAEERGLC